MSVFENAYGQYEGRLTPEWSRFLVIPRYNLREVFRSKLFTALFCLCFIYPLVAAILIYLHHNANAIALLRINVRELLPINASFFQYFVELQGWLAFFLTVLAGPPLVSRDLANNALPLYLYRPFSRAEYVLGKLSVIVVLLSLITWVPGLLLFALQAYLEGAGWLWSNLWMSGAIFIGSITWIVLLALLALAVSAWVKWRVVASGTLLGMFLIPSVFGAIVNNLFLTRMGHLISLGDLIKNIWRGLFGHFVREADRYRTDSIRGRGFVDVVLLEPPLWACWLMIALVCAACLWLLARKIRAYEVVK
ncbi:MAG: ABC transporter permease [Pyrinomonadaceae bacterium]|nr:ABC transporter permease [Pyrinomonadaceae bacterium]